MKIFRQKILLQKNISEEKDLSFVPTMGGLHKGHKKLRIIKIIARPNLMKAYYMGDDF